MWRYVGCLQCEFVVSFILFVESKVDGLECVDPICFLVVEAVAGFCGV